MLGQREVTRDNVGRGNGKVLFSDDSYCYAKAQYVKAWFCAAKARYGDIRRREGKRRFSNVASSSAAAKLGQVQQRQGRVRSSKDVYCDGNVLSSNATAGSSDGEVLCRSVWYSKGMASKGNVVSGKGKVEYRQHGNEWQRHSGVEPRGAAYSNGKAKTIRKDIER